MKLNLNLIKIKQRKFIVSEKNRFFNFSFNYFLSRKNNQFQRISTKIASNSFLFNRRNELKKKRCYCLNERKADK